MKSPTTGTFALIVLFFTVIAILSGAQTGSLKADEPTVSYIFPAGGQRGQTVKFNVGGHFLHGKAPFEMLGTGIQTSREIIETETLWLEGPLLISSRQEDYPRDHSGQVMIAADAKLGDRLWRVWTSQGATHVRKFVIGDLPEIVEQEIEGRPIPVLVKLPVTINGRMFPREDIDAWTFSAKAGESFTCEVNAARIGSPLDARLEIRGPDGKTLAEASDGLGVDPRIRFVAPVDGVYQVRIHDVNYEGLQHYVYRLTITSDPYVDHVYPLGGRRGGKTAFLLTGQRVPAGPLDVLLPSSGPREFLTQLPVDGKQTNPFVIELGDTPEHLESEPNDHPWQSGTVESSAMANGRIDKPGDVDYWSFGALKGTSVQLDLRAARLGSPLDSVLEVLDVSGKVLSSNDDLGAGQSDSRLVLKVPADGTYLAKVSERFDSRGGPAFAYRLEIAQQEQTPDFRLTLPSNVQRKQYGDVVTVFRDPPVDPNATDDPKKKRKGRRRLSQPSVLVEAERQGGFEGEITLSLVGLPEGVTVSGDKIPVKKPNTTIKFTAAHETKIGISHVVVQGTAEIDGKQVTRRAVITDAAVLDHVLLAVALPTPFQVIDDYTFTYSPAGSVLRRKFRLDRGGFVGPLTVRLADRQGRHLQGVRGPTNTLPPGTQEFEYPVTLPPGMTLGRTSRSNIMLSGTVKDHDGSEHIVSFSDNAQGMQIITILSPGQLAIELRRSAVLVQPGATVEISLRVRRAKPLAGLAVLVEMVVPSHMVGIAAKPVTVSVGQEQVSLVVRFDSDVRGINMPVLIRATTLDKQQPVYTETKLELVNTAGTQ